MCICIYVYVATTNPSADCHISVTSSFVVVALKTATAQLLSLLRCGGGWVANMHGELKSFSREIGNIYLLMEKVFH